MNTSLETANPFLIICYANEEELLSEIGDALLPMVEKAEEPEEVDSPAMLNLDPATIAQTVWEMLIVFGSVKASLEAIQLIIQLLRDRSTKGKTATVEFTIPSGVTIKLEGNMSPEEVAKAVASYQSAFKEDE